MYMELDTMDILSIMMLFYGQEKLKTSKIVQPSLLEATVPKSLLYAICQIELPSTHKSWIKSPLLLSHDLSPCHIQKVFNLDVLNVYYGGPL